MPLGKRVSNEKPPAVAGGFLYPPAAGQNAYPPGESGGAEIQRLGFARKEMQKGLHDEGLTDALWHRGKRAGGMSVLFQRCILFQQCIVEPVCVVLAWQALARAVAVQAPTQLKRLLLSVVLR